MSLAKIDALLTGEQYREAMTRIKAALEAEPAPDEATRWLLELRRARLAMLLGEEAVDELLFVARDLLAEACVDHEDVAPEVEYVHALMIRGYTRKRCQELAAEAVTAAREAVGEALHVLVAQGGCALALDDREAARDLYARALELYPERGAAHLAMANLAYVVGDFEEALERLGQVTDEGLYWARGVRLRATVHAARQEFDQEAEQWRLLLQRLPEGDWAVADRLALALALAADGHRDDALEQFREAWRADPDSSEGQYARERIEFLEHAPGDMACKRLPAFPTTRQRYNYCGPAVLELCLRYLDIDLGQEEIAQTVKRSAGTPMYEIVQYLRDRGVAARRVEATPDRLRAAIDLGLPVIVQEEYSTTSHVAVITGYDESLGLFIANDPMTHRQALRSFKWTARAGALFGNGGVIVLGREGEALEQLLARADEAGLVEARHLCLLDECDRQRPKPGSGEAEDVTLQQVRELCTEALSISPRFKLAWHRLWHAENSLYARTGSGVARDGVLARLHHVRTVFSEDEWPHQLHGHWLMDTGRYEEAFTSYFEASRRDPQDANNVEEMGECKWLAGDLADAERFMLEALALDPSHARASENLAGVYLRELEARDLQARGREPDVIERMTTMAPSAVTRSIDRTTEQVLRRARHHSRVACSLRADNPYNQEVAGSLLAREGHFPRSVEAFRKAREMDPSRPFSLWRLARSLESDGRGVEAREVLEEGCQRFWRNPGAWLALSSFLRRVGDHGQAAQVLGDALNTLGEGHSQLVGPLFNVLKQLESAEAAAKLRGFAERRSADEDLLRAVAYLLDEQGQRGHAVALLRHVVAMAPSDVSALYRLGVLLSEDMLSREEGIRLLEEVVELAPDSPAPRRYLAWLHMPGAPGRGLELLEPVLDQEDPYVFETRSALLAAQGQQEEADEAFARALEAMGSPGPGLVDLCYWHINGLRYDRALELARQVFDHPLPDDVRREAEDCWMSAHRLTGTIREGLDRVRELCNQGVPDHLAWEVYWGLRSIDQALAAEAALSYSRQLDDPEDAQLWRIKAAGKRAHGGDEAPLLQARQEAGDRAAAWAELSWVYEDLKRYDEASETARRAYELDPTDKDALTAMEEAHVRANRLDEALRCAEQLYEKHPHEHQGPERLGILLAKLGRTDEALEHSLHAIDAAPFCHISHRSRAVALFCDGQLEQAEKHARRSLLLDEPDEEDAGDDALMVLRAVTGDADGVRRCLATLARSEPAEAFVEYKKLLVDVAKQ